MGKDKLNSLNKKYIKQSNIEKSAKEKKENIESEMVNEVIKMFQDENERNLFISEAQKYCFSDDKIATMRSVFDNFNQDNITYNFIEDVIDADRHIQEHKRESFFSLISNVIPEEE